MSIPRTVEEACDPRRLALIVYDMQVGVLNQIADASRVVSTVSRTISAARAGGYRVFYLRHMGIPNSVSGVSRLRMGMNWQRLSRVSDVVPMFLRDSPGFALDPCIVPLDSEMIFDKIAMSAFVGTPLELVLRDCGLDSFAICGVATEVGIEPTVRHGADLGFLPVVVNDACGAGDSAAGQRSLESLAFSGDSLFVSTSEICSLLSG